MGSKKKEGKIITIHAEARTMAKTWLLFDGGIDRAVDAAQMELTIPEKDYDKLKEIQAQFTGLQKHLDGFWKSFEERESKACGESSCGTDG